MERTRLSSKGQVIIPKSLRVAIGLNPGDEFSVTESEGSIVLTPLRPFAKSSIEEAFGCLNYAGPTLSLQDMEAGIEMGARNSLD